MWIENGTQNQDGEATTQTRSGRKKGFGGGVSWARGINSDGREVGYAIEAKCDHPECAKVIDRGLSYICGSQIEGGEYGCGKFFCESHRRTTLTGPATVSLCAACLKEYDEAFPEGRPIYVQPEE